MYFNAQHYNHTKASSFRKAANATLRYISTREVDGEKVRIPVFGWKSMELEEAKALIQERSHMKPLRIWIVKFSPDIVKENTHKDLDLWELARKTLDYIREHDLIVDGKPVLRDGKPVKVSIDPNAEFILAEHTDTNIPHVQGLLFFNGRLEKHDLKRMKDLAHEYALKQQLVRKPVLQFLEKLQQGSQKQQLSERLTKQYHRISATAYHPAIGIAGGRAKRGRKVKEPTIACPHGMSHMVVKWKGKDWCKVCEQVLNRERKVLDREQGLGL